MASKVAQYLQNGKIGFAFYFASLTFPCPETKYRDVYVSTMFRSTACRPVAKQFILMQKPCTYFLSRYL